MDRTRLDDKRRRVAALLGEAPTEVVARFARSFDVEYAHNSTAIEGNTLSLIQTKVILEDGLSVGGKALREILPKIRAEADVDVRAMIISVDRQEKGAGEKSAVQEAYDEFGVRVYSIVTVEDIIEAIETGVIGGKEHLEAMRAYRAQYGV